MTDILSSGIKKSSLFKIVLTIINQITYIIIFLLFLIFFKKMLYSFESIIKMANFELN